MNFILVGFIVGKFRIFFFLVFVINCANYLICAFWDGYSIVLMFYKNHSDYSAPGNFYVCRGKYDNYWLGKLCHFESFSYELFWLNLINFVFKVPFRNVISYWLGVLKIRETVEKYKLTKALTIF